MPQQKWVRAFAAFAASKSLRSTPTTSTTGSSAQTGVGALDAHVSGFTPGNEVQQAPHGQRVHDVRGVHHRTKPKFRREVLRRLLRDHHRFLGLGRHLHRSGCLLGSLLFVL